MLETLRLERKGFLKGKNNQKSRCYYLSKEVYKILLKVKANKELWDL